jgi:hypothetical protein
MENCDDLLGSILDNELILLVPRGGIEPPTLRFSVAGTSATNLLTLFSFFIRTLLVAREQQGPESE